MFFQWRQAKYGQEKFHSSMLGHRGERSRSFRETKALGLELKKLEPGARHPRAFARGARRRLGLLVGHQRRRVAALAAAAVGGAGTRLAPARCTRSASRSTPCARPARSTTTTWSWCRTSTSSSSRRPTALRGFVERGGHLVVGPFSGVVDATEKVHDGGAPGPLRDLLGIEVDEQWPIADGLTARID